MPKKQKSPAGSLLEEIGTIVLHEIDGFVAADHFIVWSEREKRERGGMHICGLSDMFRTHFLPKREEGYIEPCELAVRELQGDSGEKSVIYDPAIIEACGGEKMVGISLGQFFFAFKQQSLRRRAPLHTNGNSNIAYIQDVFGCLLPVCGFRHNQNNAWYFGVARVDNPNRSLGWYSGRRVISAVSPVLL